MNKGKSKYFTYALYSYSFSRLYIGQTDDVNRRLTQHNEGKVDSTKPYKPYKLIYFEEHLTREDAVKREKELKTSEGRRFLKKFI